MPAEGHLAFLHCFLTGVQERYLLSAVRWASQSRPWFCPPVPLSSAGKAQEEMQETWEASREYNYSSQALYLASFSVPYTPIRAEAEVQR